MAIVDTAEEFRIGRVVSRLFDALFANLVTFLALAALLMIPVLLLTIYTTTNLASVGVNPTGGIAVGGGMHFFGLIMAQTVIYLVFGYILQAALIYGTLSYLNGERPSFGQCFSNAL